MNPRGQGTKTAWHYALAVPAGGEVVVRLRLVAAEESQNLPLPMGEGFSGTGFGEEFERMFARRRREADDFYAARLPNQENLSAEERRVARQAYAGLLLSKQFYHSS